MTETLRLGAVDVEARRLAGGGLVMRSRRELGPYARCVGEHLRFWAGAAPDRTFLAERDRDEGWRRVSFGAALDLVERIASALLARGLDESRPVALLSDNGIDHGLLQLAAMQVGIPAVPISPAYSLLAEDHAQLRYVLGLVRPGLVYAADGTRFAKALATAAGEIPAEIVVSANPPAGLATTLFGSLLETARHPDLAQRSAAVGPDTVAKVLFTSGSTGKPKGVINTQRMLCSNQQALAQAWPFLEDRPPVIVDWLPWSHTFGGNHNFNLALRNGGTLYIDGGKPAPGLIETTVRNLREVPSTFYFNVPRGYEMLIPYLERDAVLRETFFRDLDAVFYAAAALPQHLWEKLEQLAIAATGRKVVMLSAWGSTETAPSATQIHFLIERAGVIGLPGAGTEIKLAPAGDKLELRVHGPNVTPGYWRRPELAQEAFDEEGFLKTGDAGKLLDADDPAQGIVFDGRIAENFKLTSGTWVHVGELRLEVITAGAPVVQDVVVTGHDREDIGLLVFANPAECRALCPGAAEDTPLADLIRRPEVRERLAAGLAAHNAEHRASSRRIARALLLAEPPSLQDGEITDKGYVNQRAVLARRAALVDLLYAGGSSSGVIVPAATCEGSGQ
ncbi:MAG TPA: feruloyl-CoA synthase [Thermoanaerobaculia bacterium]|nr:feruloyl-CoA synthase [Thermoanaerobaculia bacterium]